MKENSNKIDNEQENFLKKFKGQIQTLGKDGIIGSIGNNNENKIIHFNNFKTNNLKPIKKNSLKTIKEKTSLNNNKNNISDILNINNNINN